MKMFNEDEKFDLKIRSVLESGREEVPDHIWDGIQARLDGATPAAAEHKADRHVLLWLRRAGAGIAAAAAIVAVFIFSGLFDLKDSSETQYSSPVAVADRDDRSGTPDDTDGILIAEALPEETSQAHTAQRIPAEITVAEAQETVRDTGAEEAAVQETTAEESSTQQRPETPEQETGAGQEPGGGREKASEGLQEDGTWDSFDEFPEEKGRRKVRTSITVSGNATSNSNAENSSGSYMMAPGPGYTGIREISEGNSRYGIPVSAGAGVRIGFTPKWSLGIGINYSFLTRTFDGIYTEEGKNPVEYSDIRNSQHYVGIPVNVYYNIVQKNFIDFYAYAGGTAELCIANKYTAHNAGHSLYYRGDTGSAQLSANIGIGVEFILTDHLGLYIDPSLRYYFRNSKAPKSIRTVQPLMLGFEAGFRIRL